MHGSFANERAAYFDALLSPSPASPRVCPALEEQVWDGQVPRRVLSLGVARRPAEEKAGHPVYGMAQKALCPERGQGGVLPCWRLCVTVRWPCQPFAGRGAT
ncbi:hypothetical protein [Nitrospira sp. Kam-Ns4a]